MRIISGKWRGRRFDLPKGVMARPTSDRIREAIFSIFGERVHGAKVLDMFCGSGAIGMEALSRGADYAVFCDSDRRCITKLKERMEEFGEPGSNYYLIADDYKRALSKLKAKEPGFDIIYIDPPYKAGYYVDVIGGLQDLMDADGVILAEHDRRDALPDRIGLLEKKDSRRYGDIQVSFYGRTS